MISSRAARPISVNFSEKKAVFPAGKLQVICFYAAFLLIFGNFHKSDPSALSPRQKRQKAPLRGRSGANFFIFFP